MTLFSQTTRMDPSARAQPFTDLRVTGAEWSASSIWPPCVYQRDEEYRASVASRVAHLKTEHPMHACVTAARLPDGSLCKIDGHTRAYMWRTGKAPMPDYVFVRLWDVANLADIKRLYDGCDSRAAVETAPDRVASGVRAAGLDFDTGWLRYGTWTVAVRTADRLWRAAAGLPAIKRRDQVECIADWSSELELFDQFDVRKRRFPAQIMAAALCSIRRYADTPEYLDVVNFWRRYDARAGTLISDASGPSIVARRDAIDALCNRVDSLLATGYQGRKQSIDDAIIGACFSAVTGWLANQTYEHGLRSMKDLKRFFKGRK